MSKKYKLIKDLPDLKAGAIFEWDESQNSYKCKKGVWVPPNQYHYFSAGTVKYSPEFWEEVPEKSYRIVNFIETVKNPTPNKTYSCMIKTVERLSDNESFQIGDNTNNGIIKEFREESNMIRVYFKDSGPYNMNLNTLKKVNISKKEFPNGFVSWYKTFYEIVAYIERTNDNPIIQEIINLEVGASLYELAKKLTDKFERLNKDKCWEGDFYDTINIFLEEELK